MNKFITILFFTTVTLWGNAQVISSFPYNEAFTGESNSTSCTTPFTMSSPGWENDASSNTQWRGLNSATPSSNTGPDFDHTTGTGKYMYVESSGCNNATALLMTPYFNFTNNIAPKLEFWYHMFGATMGTLSVDAKVGSAGAWTPIWGPITDNVNTWQEADVDLIAFAGLDSVRLRFRGLTGSSFTSDMGIDDVKVFEPAPNDLQVINVGLGVNSGCGLGMENMDIQAINIGSDTIPSGSLIVFSYNDGTNAITETLTTTADILPSDTILYIFNTQVNFTALTTYSFWGASSLASDTNLGNDTLYKSINNIPLINTFPYYQDFESGAGGWLATNNLLGVWTLATPAKTTIIGAASGVMAWVTGANNSYNDNDNSWVTGPCFDFSSFSCDPYIDMDVWWNAEFSWDGMNLQSSIDGGNTWINVGNFGDPFNWYTDNTIVGSPGGSQEGWSGRASTGNGSGGWVTARHKLTGLAGQVDVKLRVTFGTDGSVVDDGVAFDNVHIYGGTDLASATIGLTYCEGDTLQLNGFGATTTFSTYLWSTGENTETIEVTSSGTYALTVTDIASGCISTGTLTLTESPTCNPIVDFDCIANTAATPAAPTLALNAANPTGAIDASWPVASAPSYTLRWRPQGANGFAQRTVSTNSFSTTAFSQLLSATTYNFWVINRCSNNSADFYTSPVASLATASPSAGCGAPAISCGATSPTTVTFEWPELTAATRVGIRYSFVGQAGYTQRSSIAYTTTAGTSSFTLSGLQANQMYTITPFAECDGRVWWGSPITCNTGIAASRLSNETYSFSFEGDEYVNVKMTDFQFFAPAAGLSNHTVDVSSGQLVVSFEEASQQVFSFGLLPNVTSDMTSLSFMTSKATDANLSIYSLNGTLVYQQALGQVQNAQRVELNTTEFAAGVYQVVVQTNDTQYSQKLVVVK